jgi:hypothetical protein
MDTGKLPHSPNVPGKYHPRLEERRADGKWVDSSAPPCLSELFSSFADKIGRYDRPI